MGAARVLTRTCAEPTGLEIAGVVQWQNGSFPSFIRGFDSLRPLHLPTEGSGPFSSATRAYSRRMGQSTVSMRRRSDTPEPVMSLPTGLRQREGVWQLR